MLIDGFWCFVVHFNDFIFPSCWHYRLPTKFTTLLCFLVLFGAFRCFLVLFNDFIFHHVDTIVYQLRGGPRPQLYPYFYLLSMASHNLVLSIAILTPYVSELGVFSLMLTRFPWEFRKFGNSGKCHAKWLWSKVKLLPRPWEFLGSENFSPVLARSLREFREFGNSGNSCAKWLFTKPKSLPWAWELLGSHISSRQRCVLP